MTCGFCRADVGDDLLHRGIEASICVACVSMLLQMDSDLGEARLPDKPEEIAARVESLRARLVSAPEDPATLLELAGALAKRGETAEAGRLSLEASKRYGERNDMIGAYGALRQAVQLLPDETDLRGRFQAAEDSLGDGPEAELAKLFGKLATDGGVFRGVRVVEDVDEDPRVAALAPLVARVPAEGRPQGCSRHRMDVRADPAALAEASPFEREMLAPLVGTRCHFCGEEQAERPTFVYDFPGSDRRICHGCVRLAAERLASGPAQ